MRTISNLFFVKSLKHVAAITAIGISMGIANSALATLIDFDDLNPVYDPDFPCWCDNPLTDQYLSQGLLIDGAWVNGENHDNVMLTSNWASLDFVGVLPTFVSMYVTSQRGDAIYFDASNPSGYGESKHTAGWQGPFEEDIPPIPNELITFSSESGISHIIIQGFYNMRTEAAIDNLTFTYSSVPEPSPIALICLGLFGIAWRRYKY